MPAPAQPLCLQAASTFRWSEAALLSAQVPLPIHGLFTLHITQLLSVSSCYLPPVSTVTFSPLVLSYLER